MKQFKHIFSLALMAIFLSSCTVNEMAHITPSEIVVDSSAQTVSFKTDLEPEKIICYEKVNYKDFSNGSISVTYLGPGDIVQQEWFTASCPTSREVVLELEKNETGKSRYIYVKFSPYHYMMSSSGSGQAWLTQTAD